MPKCGLGFFLFLLLPLLLTYPLCLIHTPKGMLIVSGVDLKTEDIQYSNKLPLPF